MFSKFAQYLRDVKIELTKVTWPSKDELLNSTTVVIVVSLVFAVFIFAVDRLLSFGLGIILNMK